MRLEDKHAVVTGGARGIGQAIALMLASEGANVSLLDLDVAAARETAEEIEAIGRRAAAVQCDVTKSAATKVAVDEAIGILGPVDILINNAGVDRSQFFVETDEAQWDLLININYKGFLNASHACIPSMMEQGSGAIVSLGSAAGRVGNSGEVVYCGTKAAIMASSKALARELARYAIRVNCVAPGPVQTDLLAGLFEGEKGAKIMDSVAKAIPMKRIGVPEDVANVVLFLVSEQSAYLTGQVVAVDGGLTMIG